MEIKYLNISLGGPIGTLLNLTFQLDSMDDDAFLQEFYRAVVVGDKSEKIAYLKKLPKSLTVDEIIDLVDSGANVTEAVESRSMEQMRYLKASAAYAIHRAVAGAEPPTYEVFKTQYDFITNWFKERESEIEKLKEECGDNTAMFNYMLFEGIIPKGENLDMMFG